MADSFHSTVSGIEAAVCVDIASRQQLGISKYGVTVSDNPLVLREWLVHAYQECLDQAVYLRRAIAEIDKVEKFRSEYAAQKVAEAAKLEDDWWNGSTTSNPPASPPTTEISDPGR